MLALSEIARLQNETSTVSASATDSDAGISINADTPGTTPPRESPAQQITQRDEESMRHLCDKMFMGKVVTSFSIEEYAAYVVPLFREFC